MSDWSAPRFSDSGYSEVFSLGAGVTDMTGGVGVS